MGGPQGAEAITPVPLQGQLAVKTPWIEMHHMQLCICSVTIIKKTSVFLPAALQMHIC